MGHERQREYVPAPVVLPIRNRPVPANIERMYDDTPLRQIDQDTADVLKASLQRSERGAGVLYEDALKPDSPFNIVIDVENLPDKMYYGYTDVVYTGTKDSYLFGKGEGEGKFDALRAANGLSLRIVLNVAHATEPGQRLSTLVHEFGVHATTDHGAISAFNRPVQKVQKEAGGYKIKTVTTEKGLVEIQLTHLESEFYSGTRHHEEFGKGGAGDYDELKSKVEKVLGEWGSWSVSGIAGSLLGDNKWKHYLEDFTAATAAGEKSHEEIYWHPVLEVKESVAECRKLLAVMSNVESTADAFRIKSKESASVGLFEPSRWRERLGKLFGGEEEKSEKPRVESLTPSGLRKQLEQKLEIERGKPAERQAKNVRFDVDPTAKGPTIS